MNGLGRMLGSPSMCILFVWAITLFGILIINNITPHPKEEVPAKTTMAAKDQCSKYGGLKTVKITWNDTEANVICNDGYAWGIRVTR